MDEHTWWCPLGDGPLVVSLANGRHETCPGCKGFAVTIWLLDELLVDGAGGAIWRAAEGAQADGHPCPGCRTPMRRVVGPRGAGVEVCRDCEVVWVDAAVQPLLPARPELAAMAALASSSGLGTSAPVVCPNCGAPYSTTEEGECRYCRAKVAAPVLATSAPELAEDATKDHVASRTYEGATDAYLDAVADGAEAFRI
ncbi:MAG TPA: hypothetical protein VMU14_22925 [Acidimicrobiales bacterium]|nr:hypothetical protein [Acidimicrobiales bacterium]